MAIIREFRCNDCGHQFESMELPEDVSCPQCSGESEREFRTAPGIKSPDTSFNDKTVKALAQDFGLSNISNKGGQAAKLPVAPTGPAPTFTNNQQFMARLAQLGTAADNASQVLPMFAGRGPRTWNKTPMVRK